MDTQDLMLLTEARKLAESGEARAIRKRAGLSLQEIAAAIGTNYVTLRRWELALRRPTMAEPAIRWLKLIRKLEATQRAS